MKNFGQMMKQAQQMQSRMAEMQEQLANVEIAGQAGGGMVSVVLNGKGVARKVQIDRSLMVPDDTEVLEDLIVAAINDARAKLDAHMQEKMAELTGGLQLPGGLKLPF
jgi:DNA-binding YbaB/EbfC family protein